MSSIKKLKRAVIHYARECLPGAQVHLEEGGLHQHVVIALGGRSWRFSMSRSTQNYDEALNFARQHIRHIVRELQP